jgi:hypothetical protein
MFFLTIISDYLIWHYSTALISFIRVYKNFWWFTVQFFSIPQLTSSLLAPYKRMTERRGSLFDIEAWVGFIAINLMSRLLGFIIRLVIIGAGLLCLGVLCLVSVIGYGVWLSAPLITLYCFTYGLYLLF